MSNVKPDNKPKIIKSGYLCKGCGAWLPFEKCGKYCKVQGAR